MADKGYVHFTDSVPFQDDIPLLDGVAVAPRQAIERTPSPGANVLQMFDGTAVLQLDYRDAAKPDSLFFYAWAFGQRATTEAAWWKLKELFSRRRPVWFVDFDVEVVTFTAGPQLTTFTLPRPTAKSKMATFPFGSYPIKAWLNGAAQVVIESGNPTAGQVKVVESTVTTPTLVAGDLLVVRYVPAYSVVVTELPQTWGGNNDLVREVRLVEARAFA